MAQDILSCMKAFIAVTECHGFAPAARKLKISTPALTKKIQALEEKLGQKLLERTTRRLELTSVGRLYMEHASRILREVEVAAESLKQLTEEPQGHVRLGIPGVFETLEFTQHVQKFLDLYPKVTVDISEQNSPVRVLEGDLDLTLSEIHLHDKQLIQDPLLTLTRKVYAAPSYLEKYGTPKTISDLQAHNCLVYPKVSPDGYWWFGHTKKIKVKGNYTSSIGRNYVFACISGLGLIWGISLFLQEGLQSGKIVEVALDYPGFESQVYLYYRPTSSNQLLKLMVAHLKQFVDDLYQFHL